MGMSKQKYVRQNAVLYKNVKTKDTTRLLLSPRHRLPSAERGLSWLGVEGFISASLIKISGGDDVSRFQLAQFYHLPPNYWQLSSENPIRNLEFTTRHWDVSHLQMTHT